MRWHSLFVCLCTGTTSEMVAAAVAGGAVTSKQIAAACGAGADCGRCRRTLRAIVAAGAEDNLHSMPGRANANLESKTMRFDRMRSCARGCEIECRHAATVNTAIG